ncbi:Glyoxalase-like domain protein [Mycolicibacterium obuense]|uniref:Glyoxalase-like domain protein n=2 Tax=Mycolicibacterium obuense TaxID=1807 RepID=A0A0J6VNL8_9MYCO|nr:Glyoxalase-like domain protein [Mycolicibacterium obuense]
MSSGGADGQHGMAFTNVLAVLPVADVEASRPWFTALFGRPEDNNPMPSLIEWQVLPGAWLQVFGNADRAGSGLFNLAVDDLDATLAELRARGLEPGEVVEANKGVRLSALTDPDGNTITVIGGFRVQY